VFSNSKIKNNFSSNQHKKKYKPTAMSAEDAEPTKQMQIDPDDEEMIQKARQGRREYRKFLEISKILKIPKSSSHKRFFFHLF